MANPLEILGDTLGDIYQGVAGTVKDAKEQAQSTFNTPFNLLNDFFGDIGKYAKWAIIAVVIIVVLIVAFMFLKR